VLIETLDIYYADKRLTHLVALIDIFMNHNNLRYTIFSEEFILFNLERTLADTSDALHLGLILTHTTLTILNYFTTSSMIQPDQENLPWMEPDMRPLPRFAWPIYVITVVARRRCLEGATDVITKSDEILHGYGAELLDMVCLKNLVYGGRKSVITSIIRKVNWHYVKSCWIRLLPNGDGRKSIPLGYFTFHTSFPGPTNQKNLFNFAVDVPLPRGRKNSHIRSRSCDVL
jgi:hypothetical protein